MCASFFIRHDDCLKEKEWNDMEERHRSLSIFHSLSIKMQVDAHKQKIMYRRERRRGKEKVRGIETKLQSFVSHRWKDGERREEGAVASDEKIPQRWGDVGNAVVLRGIWAASDWLLACVCANEEANIIMLANMPSPLPYSYALPDPSRQTESKPFIYYCVLAVWGKTMMLMFLYRNVYSRIRLFRHIQQER